MGIVTLWETIFLSRITSLISPRHYSFPAPLGNPAGNDSYPHSIDTNCYVFVDILPLTAWSSSPSTCMGSGAEGCRGHWKVDASWGTQRIKSVSHCLSCNLRSSRVAGRSQPANLCLICPTSPSHKEATNASWFQVSLEARVQNWIGPHWKCLDLNEAERRGFFTHRLEERQKWMVPWLRTPLEDFGLPW